jgi:hypothetical protein
MYRCPEYLLLALTVVAERAGGKGRALYRHPPRAQLLPNNAQSRTTVESANRREAKGGGRSDLLRETGIVGRDTSAGPGL